MSFKALTAAAVGMDASSFVRLSVLLFLQRDTFSQRVKPCLRVVVKKVIARAKVKAKSYRSMSCQAKLLYESKHFIPVICQLEDLQQSKLFGQFFDSVKEKI